MREKGIDYFRELRRATLSQHAFAIENPNGYRTTATASGVNRLPTGPIDGTLTIDAGSAPSTATRARRDGG